MNKNSIQIVLLCMANYNNTHLADCQGYKYFTDALA